MILWIRQILGVDELDSRVAARIADINVRLDHVANRVTRNENDILDLDNYVFPLKHKKK